MTEVRKDLVLTENEFSEIQSHSCSSFLLQNKPIKSVQTLSRSQGRSIKEIVDWVVVHQSSKDSKKSTGTSLKSVGLKPAIQELFLNCHEIASWRTKKADASQRNLGMWYRMIFICSFHQPFIFHSVLLSTHHWLDTGGSSLQRATNVMAVTSHPVGLQQNWRPSFKGGQEIKNIPIQRHRERPHWQCLQLTWRKSKTKQDFHGWTKRWC